MTEILTIGYSNRSEKEFLDLLNYYNAKVIIDVRSTPYSRNCQIFNRETLKLILEDNGIMYKFGGKFLGGRPSNSSLYTNGTVDYEKMAENEDFISALMIICSAAKKSNHICLMCSEKDPFECHRAILIGRELAKCGIDVKHIVEKGNILSQKEITLGLIKKYFPHANMTSLLGKPVINYENEAYKKQNAKIGFCRL